MASDKSSSLGNRKFVALCMVILIYGMGPAAVSYSRMLLPPLRPLSSPSEMATSMPSPSPTMIFTPVPTIMPSIVLETEGNLAAYYVGQEVHIQAKLILPPGVERCDVPIDIVWLLNGEQSGDLRPLDTNRFIAIWIPRDRDEGNVEIKAIGTSCIGSTTATLYLTIRPELTTPPTPAPPRMSKLCLAVFEDVNNNGLRDPGENLLSDFTAEIKDSDGDMVAFKGISDQLTVGKEWCSDLMSGVYTVHVWCYPRIASELNIYIAPGLPVPVAIPARLMPTPTMTVPPTKTPVPSPTPQMAPTNAPIPPRPMLLSPIQGEFVRGGLDRWRAGVTLRWSWYRDPNVGESFRVQVWLPGRENSPSLDVVTRAKEWRDWWPQEDGDYTWLVVVVNQNDGKRIGDYAISAEEHFTYRRPLWSNPPPAPTPAHSGGF